MLSNPIYYPYPAPKHIENGDFPYIWHRSNFLQALIFKGILYQR